MKRNLFLGALVAIAIGTTAFLVGPGDTESLAIGAKAPLSDLAMTGKMKLWVSEMYGSLTVKSLLFLELIS